MRNYEEEFKKRVEFIKNLVASAHASGIVYGNSGGKDCTLVGILCKAACPNTLSIMMPCSSTRNYGEDMQDAKATCEQFGIEYKIVDLTDSKEAVMAALKASGEELTPAAVANIAPRLRMTTLYAAGASRGMLVAGTGNRSERYMGYFTKWGDGACDFNPISDLTVGEIFEFLDYLNAPVNIRRKAPSAGLFEGQTDEKEMGVSYAAIDRYLLTGEAESKDLEIISRFHSRSAHKLAPVVLYNPEV